MLCLLLWQCGYLYAIGECGGAMERATCPECGGSLGGANHVADAGNAHALEFDGAAAPAYGANFGVPVAQRPAGL